MLVLQRRRRSKITRAKLVKIALHFWFDSLGSPPSFFLPSSSLLFSSPLFPFLQHFFARGFAPIKNTPSHRYQKPAFIGRGSQPEFRAKSFWFWRENSRDASHERLKFLQVSGQTKTTKGAPNACIAIPVVLPCVNKTAFHRGNQYNRYEGRIDDGGPDAPLRAIFC